MKSVEKFVVDVLYGIGDWMYKMSVAITMYRGGGRK